MELFKSLQEDVAASIFTSPVSYDGRKNVFSMYQLQLGPTDSREARVSVVTPYRPRPLTLFIHLVQCLSSPQRPTRSWSSSPQGIQNKDDQGSGN